MSPRETLRIKVLLALLAWPMLAFSMEPVDVIREPIDRIVEILNDPKYEGQDAKVAQREEIWKTVNPIFNFEEISKRAIGRKWFDFSDEERAAFTDLFSQFLGNTYIDKLQGEYSNEQVVYLGQNLHSDAFAEVKTKVVRGSLETPVDYRMIKKGSGSWKVYDIIVEGVSLVKNYRTQFANILNKESPTQLIERLREKLAEQNQQAADNS